MVDVVFKDGIAVTLQLGSNLDAIGGILHY